MKRAPLALFCLLLCAASASAQKPEAIALGFKSDRVYAFDGVDSVNVLNGNVVIRIPIGMSIPVSSRLSYGFSLVYNSKAWDYRRVEDVNQNGTFWMWARPNLRSNAGAGWRISVGRLIPPSAPGATGPGWVYESPSGGEHSFSTANASTDPKVSVSTDGSFLRMIEDTDAKRRVEHPDGTTQTFVKDGLGEWFLERTEDRKGNWVKFTYVRDLGNRVTKWTFDDQHGRKQTVDFQYYTEMNDTIDRGMQVTKVTLQGVGGTNAVYEFEYDNTTAVDYPCDHTYRPPIYGAPPGTSVVYPKLSKVKLPDGTSYSFSYFTSGNCYQGLLRDITLPTQGKVEYTYQGYWFPPEDRCASTGPGNESPGVRTRTVDGQTWSYLHTVAADADVFDISTSPDSGKCPAKAVDLPPEVPNHPKRWARTSILTPADAAGKRTRTDHYFGIFIPTPERWQDQRLNAEAVNDIARHTVPMVAGLPPADEAKKATPSNAVDDISGADPTGGGRYVSEQLWYGCDSNGDCTSGEHLRTVYRSFTWAMDRFDDRDLLSERVAYEDDQGCAGATCYTVTTFSDFDGAGHARAITRTSNFPDSPSEEISYTNYPTWTRSDVATKARPWVLTRYSEKRRKVGNDTDITQFCFADTGELLRERILANQTISAKDLITQYAYGADGNLNTIESYGGDTQAVNATEALCSMTLPAEKQYFNGYSFTRGVATGSWYIDPATNTAFDFYTFQYGVDLSTGLVTQSVAPDKLATTYAYESWGRLKSVTPPGEAATTYTYAAATATAFASVTAKRDPISSQTTDDVVVTYEYDRMGRLRRTERTLPGAGCSEQVITYDALGRRSTESVWKACNTTAGVTSFRYDPFGRVTLITAPDGTSTSTAYTGVRELARTRAVGTSFVVARERYDALGRLVRVTENADTNLDDLIDDGVTTWYAYDEGDRLTSVAMQKNPAPAPTPLPSGWQAPPPPPMQRRSFSYDGRGLLLSETHPELGASGNGAATYSNYDARGHAQRKAISGGPDLTMEYDAAERLKVVGETATARKLKEWAYDNFPPCTGTICRGKVAATARYHYDTDLSTKANGELAVTEGYQYDLATGRPARRDVTIDLNPSRSFAFTQTYDAFGNVLTTSYPCPTSDGSCIADEHTQAVTNGYERGMLTSVGQWASKMTYQTSGIIDTVTHGSGSTAIREVWTADPNKLPRPRAISALNEAGTALWTSGNYTYDGSGNITAIGTTAYVYDAFHRLHRWTKTKDGATDTVIRLYDAFGNHTSTAVNGCAPIRQHANGQQYQQCYTSGSIERLTRGTTNRYDDASYDAAGNLLSEPNRPNRNYSWDALGSMKKLTDTSIDLRYLYTVDDERVAAVNRTTNKTTYTIRNFAHQLLNVWEDAIATDGTRKLTWMEDAIFRGSQLLARETPSGTTHYVLDHLGSPRALFNSAGAEIGKPEFAPFGSGGLSNSGALQFTGHERDQALLAGGAIDLPDYMHARYYDPVGGRFLSVDRIIGQQATPQSWNRYSYVRNNPVRLIDPDGNRVFEFRIRHFIPASTIQLPHGRNVGDNRGFSLHPNASVRTERTVRVETDPAVSPTGEVAINAPRVGTSVNLWWLGLQGTASGRSMLADVTRLPHGAGVLVSATQNEAEPFPPSLYAPQAAQLLLGRGGIRSTVYILVSEDGSQISVWGSRSAFPAMEINASTGNQTFAIYRGQESAAPMGFGIFFTQPIDVDCFERGSTWSCQ